MRGAERVERVQPSATLKFSTLAKKLAKEGKNVIDMSVGEPDFKTPSHIIEAAVKAMNEGKVFYTPTRGIPELLDAIAEKLREENKIDVTSKNIIVTTGAKFAIYAAISCLIDEGDEVILLDPSWVTYEACVNLSGGKVVWVLHKENFEDAPIENYLTKKTKMIVLNSPNNPLGVVYPKSFLKKVRDLAVDHNLFVLSDEVYEKIIFEGEHVSLASFDGMLERTITVNGFSKTYSMTGWRLGYAAAPEWIIERIERIQSHSVSHPASFVQYAGVAALKSDQSFVKKMVEEFKARKEIITSKFKELGIKFAPPKGAFYIFFDSERDSFKFCEEMLEKKYVALTPGAAFGPSFKTWVRLSYATSRKNIIEFLNRFEDFIKSSF
ncbi:MAG: pyridoxal phosphate-dependent aminotransferase [Archaeoglobaceae archaeon]|nr:pyridoxal phosphate-dependent aminotransferase [Archaeoglobaceae archaeon]MCX8151865.1 pyridoxal phosphate-dependent aminotransferase [Archaeoglobaceae archaeon]MDW8014303.1 pyridoxal phosphate-dependent aminotransferase [Archaeoglobaceae archaeon]